MMRNANHNRIAAWLFYGLILTVALPAVNHTLQAAEIPAKFFAALQPADTRSKVAWGLTLRYREPLADAAKNRVTRYQPVRFLPEKTAVIVCDMWDSHHSQNAARRGGELAPRMNQLLKKVRNAGGVIIHAPSGCVAPYADHPARKHAQAVARSKQLPEDIGKWCYEIPAEEQVTYPLDQKRGENDDDPAALKKWHAELAAAGRNPKAPWQKQIETLTIDDNDYISDDGNEIWSILESRGCDNVILVGVHTNMCVLGRPFGLRRLAANGKRVVLCRDLTDTIYNPARAPFVDHFTGNDLIVQHIETVVCPTITSDQILGGEPFRFQEDTRPRLVVLCAESEYQTDISLPKFALETLGKDYAVEFVFADPQNKNTFVGLEALKRADALFVSVRRRSPPTEQLQAIRKFIEAKNPVIGIRTASHAFSLRGKPVPKGHAVWDSFDADVFGGNYTNHYGNSLKVTTKSNWNSVGHPATRTIDLLKVQCHGSLYKVSPLGDETKVLMTGAVPDAPGEPIVWTNTTKFGGKAFYTSLGHIDDFKQPEFQKLLKQAIDWAVDKRGRRNATVKRISELQLRTIETELRGTRKIAQARQLQFDKASESFQRLTATQTRRKEELSALTKSVASGETITVAGRRFVASQVKEDLQRRFEVYKQGEKQLATDRAKLNGDEKHLKTVRRHRTMLEKLKRELLGRIHPESSQD